MSKTVEAHDIYCYWVHWGVPVFVLKINKTGLTGFLEGPLDELKGEGAYSFIRNIKLQKFKEKKGYRFNLEVISYLAKKKQRNMTSSLVSNKILHQIPSFW